MPIIIPRRHLSGLKLLLKLNDRQSESLKSFINKIKLSLTAEKIIDSSYLDGENRIDGFGREDLEEILGFLISVNDFRIHSNLSRSEVVEVISDSVIKLIEEDDDFEDIKNTDDDYKSIAAARIKDYLAEEGKISAISKIRSVYVEHQNTFLSSRILTDIRPVFNDNADDVLATLVLHELKIKYRHNNEEEVFFVTVDLNDIDTLIADLEKAKRKEFLIKKESVVRPELLLETEENI